MLFVDDFAGVSDSKESLQKLTDVHSYLLQANVSKSVHAVMIIIYFYRCCKWLLEVVGA